MMAPTTSCLRQRRGVNFLYLYDSHVGGGLTEVYDYRQNREISTNMARHIQYFVGPLQKRINPIIDKAKLRPAIAITKAQPQAL